jgi:hypothetical protein
LSTPFVSRPAEKNIDHISDELHRSLNRLRQSSINSELFDVVAGFNAIGGANQCLYIPTPGIAQTD